MVETNAEFERGKHICAEATPAPWIKATDVCNASWLETQKGMKLVYPLDSRRVQFHSNKDIDFIVYARTVLPGILDRLERADKIEKAHIDQINTMTDQKQIMVAKIEQLTEALNPIRKWYGGGSRSDLEILTNAIADLQTDRAKVLEQTNRIEQQQECISEIGKAFHNWNRCRFRSSAAIVKSRISKIEQVVAKAEELIKP